MADLAVDLEEARVALAAVAHRIAVLLGGEFDSSRRIPGMTWTADAVVFMLVSVGRLSHWHGLLRGQLVAWGRRPWLAMRLPDLLQNP